MYRELNSNNQIVIFEQNDRLVSFAHFHEKHRGLKYGGSNNQIVLGDFPAKRPFGVI